MKNYESSIIVEQYSSRTTHLAQLGYFVGDFVDRLEIKVIYHDTPEERIKYWEFLGLPAGEFHRLSVPNTYRLMLYCNVTLRDLVNPFIITYYEDI